MTPKQEAFVREYLIDLNATQAAIRAGYSERTAEKIGSENLKKPELASAISAAQAERAQRTEINADWVLRTLAEEKAADLADLYDDAGVLKPVRDWPMAFRRGLVAGIETVEERTGVGEDASISLVRKVKLVDRMKHLELIGKHIGVQAFKERLEVEDVTDRAELMRRKREQRLGKG